jgi:DNA-binding XRE family transcriptional regulator
MATKRYKRDLKEMELRRRKGMRMLKRGVSQAEVARACEVSRQTALNWSRMVIEDSQAWRRKLAISNGSPSCCLPVPSAMASRPSYGLWPVSERSSSANLE